MNREKDDSNLSRRKFIRGGLSLGAITGSAILLGKRDALANTLMGITDPEWQISVNGKIVREGIFSDKKEEIFIPVKSGTAHIILDKNRIYVHEDNYICEKKICSMMGSISKPGESITCLPNKMVVRVL